MQVGLREIPIVIREVDDNEIIEIALIENLQRKDLTRVRRGRGAALARRRAAATPTRTWRGGWGSRGRRLPSRCRSTTMPDEVKNLCRLADIHSKSLLLQIVRQGDPQKMVALVEKISRDGGVDPRSGPKRDRETQSRPAEGLRLQLQGADQGVQAAAPVHEVTRRARRSHRRAGRTSSKNCAKPNSGTRGSGLGARGSGLGARGSGLGARGSEISHHRKRCRPNFCVTAGISA